MSRRFGIVFLLLTLAVPLREVSAQLGSQQLGGNMKYNSGQTVQPIYEGWLRNADGTFTLHFGYLNRNHVQELHVPVGAQNAIEPGGPDRGQPTYFYPRFSRRAFSVVVPKDFGKKELVWTLTTNGRTEQAVGILHPDWEVGVNVRPNAAGTPNVPPTVDAAASATRLTTPSSVVLTAVVKDDGLPPPAPRTVRSTDGVPAFQHEKPAATVPTNLPEVERRAPRVDGRLTVTWIVWRGPAPVTFDPPIVAADKGPATVTASFTKPGTYVLRAVASDRAAVGMDDVTVIVGTP